MYRTLKRLTMVTLSVFTLGLAAAPAQAAAVPPAPGARTVRTGTVTQAQMQAWITQAQKAPSPTAAQLAAIDAYVKAHPFQGTVTALPAPAGQKVRPDVGGGYYWWGLQATLTNADVHTIIQIIVSGGIGTAAGAICGLFGGPVLIAICGIVGAVFGYAVAEIIWNNIGPYFRGNGVYVNYNYYGNYRWSWGTW